MIKVVSFASPQYSISADRMKESALRYGAEDVVIYSEADLDPFFMAVQRDLFEGAKERLKGAYYAWKPYIILDAILKLQTNDVLIYIDAGNEIVNDLRDIIRRMDGDIFLFCNCFKHVEWCKMDVLAAINHASMTETKTMSGSFYQIPDSLANAHQVQASAMFFRVTEKSIRFIKEWFAWSIMPGMIDNSPSVLPNVPTFQEHRYDQAILTSVAIKWKIPTHWFPSLTGFHIKQNHPNDQYPAIFNHHRKTNDQW